MVPPPLARMAPPSAMVPPIQLNGPFTTRSPPSWVAPSQLNGPFTSTSPGPCSSEPTPAVQVRLLFTVSGLCSVNFPQPTLASIEPTCATSTLKVKGERVGVLLGCCLYTSLPAWKTATSPGPGTTPV